MSLLRLKQLVASEPLSSDERERVNSILKAVFETANELLLGYKSAGEAVAAWRSFREHLERMGISISLENPLHVIVPTAYKPLWYNFVTGEAGYK